MSGRTGANNPMFGKVPANAFQSGPLNPSFGKSPTSPFQSGPNHPMYGKVAANAMTVNVYSLDNVLVRSFTSEVAAFANT